MNLKVGRVSPLRAVCALPNCGAHGVTRPTGSGPQCTTELTGGLSMNRPVVLGLARPGKAALKTHALQTLRGCLTSPSRAKRLECRRFIGAFRPTRDGPQLWSQ